MHSPVQRTKYPQPRCCGELLGHVAQSAADGPTTKYEEGIDKNRAHVDGIDGISTRNGDGGINSIDPNELLCDPLNNFAPVYPWNFVRTNTVFGVIHRAGGYTGWSDKPPSYSSVVTHSGSHKKAGRARRVLS